MSDQSRPSSVLRARVLAAVVRETSPTRTDVHKRRLLIIAAFAALVLIVFFLVGGFRDLGAPRSPWLIVATVSGLAALAAATTFIALDRGRSMLGRPAHQLWFILVLTPLGLFMWKVVWSSLFEGGLDPWPTRVGHKCLALVITMGLLLTTGYSLALRGERSRPALNGAATGMAAGVTAAVLVELWCPVGHPLHVIHGHITPMLVVVALGVALARVLSRVHP